MNRLHAIATFAATTLFPLTSWACLHRFGPGVKADFVTTPLDFAVAGVLVATAIILVQRVVGGYSKTFMWATLGAAVVGTVGVGMFAASNIERELAPVVLTAICMLPTAGLIHAKRRWVAGLSLIAALLFSGFATVNLLDRLDSYANAPEVVAAPVGIDNVVF